MTQSTPNPIILGWSIGHGLYICAECDDWFEHEDWTPVYQNDPESGAWSPCMECGDEL